MSDEQPRIDLPELEEKPGFPWIAVLVGVFVLILAAVLWFHHEPDEQKNELAVKALEQQLSADQTAMIAEKTKLDQMTRQLGSLKVAIKSHHVKEPKQAVADYNQLAAEQHDEIDKVQQMINTYNQKVASLRSLQQ